MKVALHFIEPAIERPESVAGVFRRRVAGGKLAHGAKGLAGGIVLGHHDPDGIADRSARELLSFPAAFFQGTDQREQNHLFLHEVAFQFLLHRPEGLGQG